ncbi:MAG TPA: lytic transglycosylase domain-containing protein [Cellvibrio sp.]|nr:lytic transglycosylase domain-containing protein [Cellvibrio sp.]
MIQTTATRDGTVAGKILIIVCIFFAITGKCIADDAASNKPVSPTAAGASSPSAGSESVGSLDEFERRVREVAKRSAEEEKLRKEQEQLARKNGEQSIKVYRYQKNGTVTFSDSVPLKTRYQVVTYTSCYACSISSNVDWHHTRLHLTAFADTITEVAQLYKVEPALIRAIIHAESAFNPLARSSKGATGLMQLMPGTAKDMGVSNSRDPEQNIQGGVKYLAGLLQTFGGNSTLAAAAYNAGPAAVSRHNGIPPYEETQTYVKRVNILLQRYRSQMQLATN